MRLAALFLTSALALTGAASAQQAPAVAAAARANPAAWPQAHSPAAITAPATEKAIDALLARMTIEQKVGQVVQGDISSVTPADLARYPLGSILAGYATPTEAAALGAVGAMLLALSKNKLNLGQLKEVAYGTTEISAMVFMILIGASLFSLVFRGFGGEVLIEDVFAQLPGGVLGAFFLVMLVIFLLGFILDFIEITFVVVPIVGPVLLAMGLDPIWLGVMIALNLQTSFLTPPFGFALFYLRGVTPASVATSTIYKGVLPFILIQILLLVIAYLFPGLITWLPEQVYGP